MFDRISIKENALEAQLLQPMDKPEMAQKCRTKKMTRISSKEKKIQKNRDL